MRNYSVFGKLVQAEEITKVEPTVYFGPRQSGNTTRLIEALREGDMIVTNTLATGRAIVSQAGLDHEKVSIVYIGSDFSRTMRGHRPNAIHFDNSLWAV